MSIVVLHLAMALCAGGFTYPMDDTYIHLMMADAKAAGLFGVGPDHAAAASSSIVYPWLLAPFALTPAALFGPAMLSAAGALALAAAAWRGAGLVFRSRDVRFWFAAVITMASHTLTLAGLGLEHSIQVALVAWAAVGLCEADRDGRPSWWLPVVLAALPAVRYDCLGVTGLGAAWLAWRGHWRSAVGSLVVAATVVGLAGLELWVHTGHPLPNSVLSKATSRSFAWMEPWQPALVIPFVVAVAAAIRSRSALALVAVAAVVGHAAVGQVGLFFRYIAYLTPLALIVGAYTCRGAVVSGWSGPHRRAMVIASVLVMLPAVQTLRFVPAASRHVAELHGGMRAIADAVGVVAVNDIGVVAWRNPSGAVDLMGLADNDTLPHVLDHDDPAAWVDDATRNRGARVAMVFDAWFPRVPASWVRLGTLGVSRSAFEESHREVVVYAVDPADADAVRATVAAVALPAGSVLKLH